MGYSITDGKVIVAWKTNIIVIKFAIKIYFSIALCLPGTFSFNGLEQCETCKKSYYQMEYGRTGCEKCPKRFTTLRRGSRGQEACLGMCLICFKYLQNVIVFLIFD